MKESVPLIEFNDATFELRGRMVSNFNAYITFLHGTILGTFACHLCANGVYVRQGIGA